MSIDLGMWPDGSMSSIVWGHEVFYRSFFGLRRTLVCQLTVLRTTLFECRGRGPLQGLLGVLQELLE